MNDIKTLDAIALELRLDVIETVYNAKDGHIGPALSCADIVTALYFNIMNIDPENPKMPGRDRFILSKGHACTILYSALAKRGYFKKDHLNTFRNYGSILQGHPVMDKAPGIDMTSGSLGNGISIGLGMALGSKYLEYNNYIYVIVGDGEMQEGIIWESIMSAAKFKADNLIVFVDANHWQSGGSTEQISAIYPIDKKFESFLWHVQTIDGHSIDSIISAVDNAKKEKGVPSVIICNTIKGKGVSFIENDNSWHKRVPDYDQMVQARIELGGDNI